MKPIANTAIAEYEDLGFTIHGVGENRFRSIKCNICGTICNYPEDYTPEGIFRSHSTTFHRRQNMTATEILERHGILAEITEFSRS